MTPERWRRVEAIYHGALERDPGAREGYLAQVCQDDAGLRRDVESLLEQPATGGWLDRPPLRADGGRVDGAVVTPLQGATLTLTPGTELAHFRIESVLSAGGMGRVYLARDTLLDRFVALKVIRSDVASDLSSQRRFIQEAKAASALNHPHIVTIYETGSAGGVDFIAMEYVRGTTLEEWRQGRDRPLGETVGCAIQVADALAAAHAAGIVHRDLKPANVMVTPQGVVKVLDFGLAKWAAPADAEGRAGGRLDVGPPTTAGLIVGTAPYASPEQAEGKPVDTRSDIFSFGALLYELVTGVRAFAGDTPMAIWSAILTQEPRPLRQRAPAVPVELERLVEACLRKDPQQRIQRVRDVWIALEQIMDGFASDGAARIAGPAVLAGPSPVAFPGLERPRGTEQPIVASPLPLANSADRRPWRRQTVLAALLLSVAVGAGIVYQLIVRARTLMPELRYTQITDFTDSAVAPAVSPDGRMVAFIRGESPFLSRDQIYVKLLPNGDAVKLTDSPAAKYGPAFSPDGSRIAYTTLDGAGWNTYSVSPLGGEPKLMVRNAAGLVWLGDRSLLFSERRGRGMNMGIVSATENRSESRDIYFPAHQRAMAHYSYPSPDRKSALVVEMDHVPWWRPCRLVSLTGSSAGGEVGPRGKCTSAGWSPDGAWMFFAAEVSGEHHLWRQRFPNGAPEQVTFGATEEDGVAVDPNGRSLITSVGMHKTAIWIHDSKGDRQISSEGTVTAYAERVLASTLGYSSSPSISRNGKYLYYLWKRESTGPAIGLNRLDLASGSRESLLPGFSVVEYDLSPDEREVVFSTGPSSDKLEIWLAPLDGSAAPRLVTSGGEDAPHFGPDGDLLVRVNELRESYIYRMNRDGSGRARVFEGPVHNFQGVSPDRQWALVLSTALGLNTTLVVPTAGGTASGLCVGGCFARWAPDGRYLYVRLRAATLSNPGKVVALPLRPGQMLPDELPVRPDAPPRDAPVIARDEVSPGPDPFTYAYVKTTINRNLFRVPLP